MTLAGQDQLFIRSVTCYDMLRFTLPAEVWRAWFSAQVTIRYEFTTIALLTLVGRNFRLNYILTQELRRSDPRSRFAKKTPFRPHFRAFCPHPVNKSAGRVRRACDDAPLSISMRLCDAPYLLASGKRGRPPTSPWPLFSRSTPHAASRKVGSFCLPDSALSCPKLLSTND